MAPAVSIELRDPDPWHVMEKVFVIVQSCLNGEYGSSSAANLIRDLEPDRRQMDEGESAETGYDFDYNLWLLYVDLVKQVQSESAAALTLADLVVAMSQPTDSDKSSIGKPWRQGGLENALIDQMTDYITRKSTPNAAEWVNLSAFGSRLFASGVVRTLLLPFQAMILCLEKPFDQDEHRLEGNILAAVYWITVNAELLWSKFVAAAQDPAKSLDIRGKQSVAFPSDVYSFERWRFWMTRLQACAELEVSDDVKIRAATAAQCMESLLSGGTHRS